jgi:mono/diheme cytochrome c family protein
MGPGEGRAPWKPAGALAVITAVVSLGCISASAADARRGEQLARQWCAGCHRISPQQQRAAAKAPAFVDIPRRTALDEARLTFYLLLEKNRQMVGRTISPSDAADLAAYIVSQGR